MARPRGFIRDTIARLHGSVCLPRSTAGAHGIAARARHALGVALLLGIMASGVPAVAQTCGDADGNGTVTVSDGVQVLREAASLPNDCTASVCDVDADGTISVADAVNVLRAAAELPATLTCTKTECQECDFFADEEECQEGLSCTECLDECADEDRARCVPDDADEVRCSDGIYG
jgi:hypothetical protein